jgi:uncharacterized protein YggE
MENISKTSIISVVGNGHIEAEANVLAITITAYKVTETIKQSQEEVNEIISNILNVLKENNISRKSIHTAAIEFKPNYTWKDNSQEYTGQRVEQKIICIVENIKNYTDKVVSILDNITIDNDSIRLRLDFGIKENREMILRCRELAYQDGFEKARRYAELAGLKIIKALKISEKASYYGDDDDNVVLCSPIAVGGRESSTQLPMGKVEKKMSLYMDFIAE